MGRKKVDPVEQALEEIAEAKKEGKTKLSVNCPNLDVARAACEVITVKDLRLSGELTELPEEFGNLENLEDVSLEQNKLTTLPRTIGKLQKLKALRCYSNKLTSLPPEIGALAKLEKAVLWSNELTTLPTTIGGCVSLVELELKWNKLVEIPSSIGALVNLEQLDLESNQLADLPRALAGMKKLFRLGLKNNKFDKFPLGVLELPALRELSLAENMLTSLPDELSRLTNLEELDLENNLIEALPAGLYALPALTSLKLSQNQVRSISKDIGKLRTLATLELEGNPVEGMAEEVLKIGKDAIFETLGLVTAQVVEDDLPADAAAVAKAAAERLDQFQRDCRKRSHDRDMLPKLIAFFTGKSNTVPSQRRDDTYGFSSLPNYLAPFADWTFVDRRIVRFIAGPAFYYRQPNHDYFTGYYEAFYKWLEGQLKEEPAGGDLFARVVGAIRGPDLDDDAILRSSLRELDEVMTRVDGTPTSYGRWLIDQSRTRSKIIGELADRYHKVSKGVAELFVKNSMEAFGRIADQLLKLEPDEDGDIHPPHETYAKLCAVDAAKYAPLVLEAITLAGDCAACCAGLAKVLAEHCGPAHRQRAFEVATQTLRMLSERSNKEERLWFPFDGHYGDSTPYYVQWLLGAFGREAKDAILKYAEDTKVFSLDVAEAIARHLGQDGVDALGEGLKMKFDDDSIAPHFRRMFSMLAPLDWSKYHDKAWELVRSEHRQVRQTACMAVSRLDPKVVLPKALELMGEKKAHLREAGVLIATLLPGDPAKQQLAEILDGESSDDVRDLVVAKRFATDGKITAAEVAKRVASAKSRGKLAKPVAKWLDEKKLGSVVFKGGKKADADTVRFLLQRQTRLADIAPEPEARAVYTLIDRDKSAAFASKLLAAVLKNGGIAAKNRFALSVIGMLGNDDVIETLEQAAIDSTNVNAATTLGLLGSHEAARALDRIMKKFRIKYPNVREAAQDAFDQIAQTLGITRFELADTMIPDFGFKNGEGTIVLGKVKARVVIDDDRKLAFFDKDKPIKSAGKGLAGKQKEALEQLRDDVDAASRTLKTNLEYYMVGGRRWAVDKWKAFFLGNPLARAFARSLVWTTGTVSFRIGSNDKLIDREGNPIKLGAKDHVALVHPLDVDDAERDAWQAALAADGLEPPFAQMTRPVFAPAPDARTKTLSFEFEDRELAGLTFKSRAERLGWRRGSVVDGGAVSAYRKLFERQQIEAFIGTDNLGVTSYGDGDVTLGQLFFVKAGAVVTGSYTYDEPRDHGDDRLIKLGDLPPIVYSETVADLHAVTREVRED